MWAWLASNVAGSNKRAAATGLIFSMGNIGGTISGQIYRAEQWAPRYVQGHAINLACYGVALVSGVLLWASYRRDNRLRDAAEGVHHGVSAQERQKGLLGEDLGDLGDRYVAVCARLLDNMTDDIRRHPHFRYYL